MELQTFLPSDILKPYVKYYWVFATDQQSINDAMYPSGYLELAINISEGEVVSVLNDRYIDMPPVEVLGQLTAPARIIAGKQTTLLVTRFYPHATALFFPNRIVDFTDDSVDLLDVFKADAVDLHAHMMDQSTLTQKIGILDSFLVRQLIRSKKNLSQISLIESICRYAGPGGDGPDIAQLALRHGVSTRYIQKLFIDCIGITPRRFFNIRRFNKSLTLVRKAQESLTSIAYECGYYDQAHFIREFKAFSGVTPSRFLQPTLSADTAEI
ncbi:helix-turn-helix domain-containing protein [Chitinophaga pinensis]|uniref:Helix-turn-helix transcriptional regulator n=1 Tax=Chitinophaga pinensis TaxID=79329 RepID=A0A5C6LYM8_9BACT|nr:AraC family transcriptional regulator [Chitinophaga pinensis]TWW01904.1 helix-turn-helix transcriptional regulator [Chitinophaga pinensis]